MRISYRVHDSASKEVLETYIDCESGAADMRALEDLLLRVSEMVCELRWLKELDLNPVIVYEKGCAIVDARVIIGDPVDDLVPLADVGAYEYPSGEVFGLVFEGASSAASGISKLPVPQPKEVNA